MLMVPSLLTVAVPTSVESGLTESVTWLLSEAVTLASTLTEETPPESGSLRTTVSVVVGGLYAAVEAAPLPPPQDDRKMILAVITAWATRRGENDRISQILHGGTVRPIWRD